MSKFDYDVFANDETTAAIFNFEKWSKEDAIEQARFELELDVEAELEVFESFIEFGFYELFSERYNDWNIRSMYNPVKRKRNSVKVYVIKEKENETNKHI